MKKLKDVTKKELLTEYAYLMETVNGDEGFSHSDMARLTLVEKEIDKRGLVIHETIKYSFE